MRLYSIVYKIRRIEMQQIILGSAGFLLYFIYDINSVRKQNRLLQKFFAAGTILVVLSLFMELWFAWGQCSHMIGRMIGFGIGAMCFLALLIYTLFFALPFEQTYCEENRLRAAYTEGVYGLCRHPGVLYFPHAVANVETRGESVFAAQNAIDGNTSSNSHGDWPYESWGINRQDDATLRILFGRKVKIDRVILYLFKCIFARNCEGTEQLRKEKPFSLM